MRPPMSDDPDLLEAQARELMERARKRREEQARAAAIAAPVRDELLTVAQFCERHRWARPGGIRYAIFHGKANGFDACIARFGRRVLLDEAKVLAWVRAGGLSRGSLKAPRKTPLRGKEPLGLRGRVR